MTSSTWSWMGRKREHEIISLLRTEAAKAHEYILLLQKLIAQLPADTRYLAEVTKEMSKIEREVNNSKRVIIEELAKGMTDPLERAEMARLALSIESIISYARAAANRSIILKEVPEPLKGIAKSLANLAAGSTMLLANAVGKFEDDPAESLTIAEKIEELERSADEQLAKAESIISENCKSEPSQCLMLLRMLESLEAITDQAENAANNLRVLVVVKTYASI